MPNTKCALIRQKVIDRCLSSDRDYSIPKLMKRCNKALEVRTIWDDEREKWFFFMLNAIGTANEQELDTNIIQIKKAVDDLDNFVIIVAIINKFL